MWKNVLAWTILCGCGILAQKVKVSIYYETLCGDSIRFLVNQFDPVYEEFADNIDVDLVAYGKASSNNASGSWEFECQHGSAECYGNKVHSCAIELYPVNQSTGFVICAMSSTNASDDANLEVCANSNNISWTTLEECMSSGQADELLAANGRRTDKLIPDLINFVPTIVLNDVFNSHLHSLSLNNFDSTVQFFAEQIQCSGCLFNASNVFLSSGKLVVCGTLLLLLLHKMFL